MAENENVFRTAFRGYNKDDVNAYIASLAGSTKNLSEEAQARVARAERETENAKAELENLSRKADELAVEAYAAANALSENEMKLAELEAKNAALEAEKASLAEKAAALESALADTGKLAAAEREKVYAELNDKIDEIMLAAKESADAIVARAEERSEKLIADAERAAEDIKTNAENRAQEMEKSISAGCYSDFRRFADSTRAEVDSLLKNIESRGNELQSKMNKLPEEKSTKETAAAAEPVKKDTKKSFDEKIDKFVKNAIASFTKSGDGKKE